MPESHNIGPGSSVKRAIFYGDRLPDLEPALRLYRELVPRLGSEVEGPEDFIKVPLNFDDGASYHPDLDFSGDGYIDDDDVDIFFSTVDTMMGSAERDSFYAAIGGGGLN